MTDERTEDRHVVEWLDAWRTGELDPERAREVEVHLESCPGCRAALSDLRAFASAVEAGYRAGEQARPEPDWGARRAAVVERTSGRRRERAPWIVRWAPQVAIVTVAVVAIGVLVEKGVREPGDVERALRAPSEETASPTASEERAPSVQGEAAPPPETDADGDRSPVEREPAAPEPTAPEPAAPEPAPRDDRAEALAERPERERAPVAEMADAEQREAAEDQARVDPEAGRAAAMRLAAPDAADRFRLRARAALESRDTTAARNALEFWADSVEPADLPAERRERLEALADSLAARLSGTR